MSSNNTILIYNNLPTIFKDGTIDLNDECFIAGGFLHRLLTGHGLKGADIDLFVVHGRTNGPKKLKKLCDVLKDNGYSVAVDKLTIKASKKGSLDIQLVPVNFSTPQMIIDSFDLSCVGLAYYNNRLLTSKHYDKYEKDSIAFCPHKRIMRHRLEKYSERGYGILLSPFTHVVDSDVSSGDEMTIDEFINNVYDIKIEGQYINEVYEYCDAFTSCERASYPSCDNAKDFCNSLSYGYVNNSYISEREYDSIIKDPYVLDSVITPGLYNDIAFGVLNLLSNKDLIRGMKPIDRSNPYEGK